MFGRTWLWQIELDRSCSGQPSAPSYGANGAKLRKQLEKFEKKGYIRPLPGVLVIFVEKSKAKRCR